MISNARNTTYERNLGVNWFSDLQSCLLLPIFWYRNFVWILPCVFVVCKLYALPCTSTQNPLGGTCSFISQGTSTRKQQSDLYGLWVKLSPVSACL